MMSAASMTPLTVPSVAGHAGLSPPLHRNAETPPFTARLPKWMCEAETVPPSIPE